jgi:hypothetical protein
MIAKCCPTCIMFQGTAGLRAHRLLRFSFERTAHTQSFSRSELKRVDSETRSQTNWLWNQATMTTGLGRATEYLKPREEGGRSEKKKPKPVLWRFLYNPLVSKYDSRGWLRNMKQTVLQWEAIAWSGLLSTHDRRIPRIKPGGTLGTMAHRSTVRSSRTLRPLDEFSAIIIDSRVASGLCGWSLLSNPQLSSMRISSILVFHRLAFIQ